MRRPHGIYIQNRMNHSKTIFALLFIISITLATSCPEHCLQCDDSGSVCFICDSNYEVNVMGTCHANTIDKCIIYGPGGQCFRCQPTHTLVNGACQKQYTGCMNEGAPGDCYQCGFGTSLEINKCKGILNCAELSGNKCKSCLDGYSLVGSICKDITPGCLEIRPNDGICSKCKSGYFLSGYRCFDNKYKNDRCYIQRSETQCNFCKAGFNEVNGRCLLSKELSSIQSAGNGNVITTVTSTSGNSFSGDSFGSASGDTDFASSFNQSYISNVNSFGSQNVIGSFGQVNGNSFEQIHQTSQQTQFSLPNKVIPISVSFDSIPSSSQQSQIRQVNLAKIENCDIPDGEKGGCLSCTYGYFPQNKICAQVSPFCDGHNIQTGACFACKYQLSLQSGRCIDYFCQKSSNDKCQLCKVGYQINQNGVCKVSEVKTIAVPQIAQIPQPAVQVTQTTYNPQIQPINVIQSTPQPLYNQPVPQPTSVVVTTTSNNQPILPPPTQSIQPISQPRAQPIIQPVNQPINQPIQTIQPISQPIVQSIAQPIIIQSSPQPQPTPISQITQQNNQVVSIITPLPQPQQNAQPQSFYSNSIPTPSPASATTTSAIYSDSNCEQYSSVGKCTKCFNRFYSNSDGKCVPVNPLCKDHNIRGDCTTCYVGYTVQAGKCVIAQNIDVNCKSFNSQGCSQCYQGYFYSANDKICKKLNPLCKTSDMNSGACQSCYSGYSINTATGNCEVSFKDPNCKQYAQSGNCKLCFARYYVNSNGRCAAANPLCREFDPLSGLCTSCYPGYVLSLDGQCKASTSVDPNCKIMQGSNCKECAPGYYLSYNDSKCKQVNPLCRTYDRSGNCLSCFSGYEVNNGQCVISQSRDPHCKKYDNNNQNYCNECYQGYIAFNGKCKQQNPLCKTLNMQNGDCSSCWPGYALQSGNCIVEVKPNNPVTAQADPYCISYKGGACSQCSSGYYLNRAQGLCIQIDPLCKTSSMDTGACLSCYGGYAISNDKCVPLQVVQIPNCASVNSYGKCQECIEGYYLNENTNECKQVSILCSGYNRRTGECLGCVQGHVLQQGQCIYPAIYDPNCARYENAYCSRCQNGYILQNYMCVPI